MSNDLISRSKLIDIILEYNSGFATTDQPMLAGIRKSLCKDLIDLVSEQPTAFDVEKVKGELENDNN